MELLTPDFLKLCGIEPVTNSSYLNKYFIDNKLSIIWFKNNIKVIQIYHMSEHSYELLIRSTDYTINEFKSLCIGLRIHLHLPIQEGQKPEHYGC